MGKGYFMFLAIMLMCCLLCGCGGAYNDSYSSDEDASVGWLEEKITMSADSVHVSEDDYAEIKDFQEFVRANLTDNADKDLLVGIQRKIHKLIGEEFLSRDGYKYYLSCIPVICWDYEHNRINRGETGLYLFNANNAYLLALDEETLDKGGLSISGLHTMGELAWMKSGNGKYIWTKADYYTSCFVGEDNVGRYDWGEKYPADLMEIKGDYYGKFDVDKIGVRYEELTNPSNCIEIVLHVCRQ